MKGVAEKLSKLNLASDLLKQTDKPEQKQLISIWHEAKYNSNKEAATNGNDRKNGKKSNYKRSKQEIAIFNNKKGEKMNKVDPKNQLKGLNIQNYQSQGEKSEKQSKYLMINLDLNNSSESIKDEQQQLSPDKELANSQQSDRILFIPTDQNLVHKENALLAQQVQFLSQQLDENQIKLKNQENLYDQVLNIYKEGNMMNEEQYSLLKSFSISGQLVQQVVPSNSAHGDKQILDPENCIAATQQTSHLTLMVEEMRQKVQQQDEMKVELAGKIQELENELKRQQNKYKFRLNDYKHDTDELKIKLKYSENKNLLKDENHQRIIDEKNQKNDQEVDQLLKQHHQELEQIQAQNASALQSLKDLFEGESRRQQDKIGELKSQIRMQELQIMEYTQMKYSNDEKNGSELGVLENIHIKYLDEIKNLNVSLRQFTSEKDAEIKSLQEKLCAMDHEKGKLNAQLKGEKEKVGMQKKEYEIRASEQRKRIDNLIRSLADHEKCETIRQAQNIRIDELKQRVKQLEYKEKWQWKSLVRKRNDVETQQYNLQKTIITQNKQLRTVLGNADEELHKKMDTINNELETSQKQKEFLISRVEELKNEVVKLRQDSQYNESETSCNQRSTFFKSAFSPRSASPKALSSNEIFSFESGVIGCMQQIKQDTSQNLSKMLKRLGSIKYRNAEIASPKSLRNQDRKNQCMKKMLSSKSNKYRENKVKVSVQVLDQSQEHSSEERQQDQEQHDIKSCNLMSTRKDKDKLQNLSSFYIQASKKNSSQSKNDQNQQLKTCADTKNKRLNEVVGKVSAREEKEEEYKDIQELLTESFLSPKLEGISFMKDSLIENTGLFDSTTITKGCRSKANSQYDVHCKICSKLFDNVQNFLAHQRICLEIKSQQQLPSDLSKRREQSDCQSQQENKQSTKQGQHSYHSKSFIKNNNYNQQSNNSSKGDTKGEVEEDNENLQNEMYNNKDHKLQKNKNGKVNQNKVEIKKMIRNQSYQSLGLGYRHQNSDIFNKAVNSRNTGRLGTKYSYLPHTSTTQDQIFSSFKQEERKTTNKITYQDQLQKTSTVPTLFRSNTSSKPILLSSLSHQKHMYGQEEQIFDVKKSLNRIEKTDDNEDLVNFCEANTCNLEEENDKLMIDLKQAKIDLALFQERSSASELYLKKEIVSLQHNLAQNYNNNGRSSSPNQIEISPSFIPTAFLQSFHSQVAPNPHQQFNTFTPPNINISTTNLTCFNLGCSDISNKSKFAFGGSKQQSLQNKEQNSEQMSVTNLKQKDETMQLKQMKFGQNNLLIDTKSQMKMEYKDSSKFRYENENIDSPTLLQSQIGDEIAPKSNNLSVRINRPPNLMEQKQQTYKFL